MDLDGLSFGFGLFDAVDVEGEVVGRVSARDFHFEVEGGGGTDFG